jgi:beta-ribofuranosylaminobenzene 5'-phosphate synthase
MIRVMTASRLHFGLFRVEGPANSTRASERRFGGVGLMVDAPRLRLAVRQAKDWSADEPLAGRALEFARRFADESPSNVLPPQHLHVEDAPPQHSGFGTGTQLALAVARALAAASGQSHLSAIELARRVGRGKRSALGVHGFAQGGLIVDAGKRDPETIASLVARESFPESWRIVLALVPGSPGLHGADETRVFQQLERAETTVDHTNALCRIVLLDLLPALAERDLPAFGDALHEFNARAGAPFAAIQGGTYASPAVAEMVSFIRNQGIRGAGQSSWGPAVFAVTEDAERAAWLVRSLRARFSLGDADVFATTACNRGATIVESEAD